MPRFQRTPNGQKGHHDVTTPTLDRETILQVIHHWPISEQIALADAILAEARSAVPSQYRPSTIPSAAFRGILASGSPAPTDEEVARILEVVRVDDRLRGHVVTVRDRFDRVPAGNDVLYVCTRITGRQEQGGDPGSNPGGKGGRSSSLASGRSRSRERAERRPDEPSGNSAHAGGPS